jgi:hypothetical protein
MLVAVICFMILIDVLVFVEDRYLMSTFLLCVQIAGFAYFIPEVTSYITIQGWVSIIMHTVPWYLGIGVGIAAVKWIVHNFKVARLIKNATIKYSQLNATIDSQVNKYSQFCKYVDNQPWWPVVGIKSTSYSGVSNIAQMNNYLTPKASQCADRITTWVLQWPIVLIAMLLEDVLGKFGRFVAELFSAVFAKLSGLLIANATRDFDNVVTKSEIPAKGAC